MVPWLPIKPGLVHSSSGLTKWNILCSSSILQFVLASYMYNLNRDRNVKLIKLNLITTTCLKRLKFNMHKAIVCVSFDINKNVCDYDNKLK